MDTRIHTRPVLSLTREDLLYVGADMDRVDEGYGPNIYEQRPPHHMWMLTTNGQKEEL